MLLHAWNASLVFRLHRNVWVTTTVLFCHTIAHENQEDVEPRPFLGLPLEAKPEVSGAGVVEPSTSGYPGQDECRIEGVVYGGISRDIYEELTYDVQEQDQYVFHVPTIVPAGR